MRFSKLVLPAIAMIAATYGLARFSFGLLLPGISESLNMSEHVAGVISSLFYFAYCFAIVVSTLVTTKEGPRRMILLAGLSALTGLLVMTGAPNAGVLALGVLFAGASTGLVSPPYGAAISLWIAREKQGKANTWVNSGTSLGIIITGVMAYFLTSNWRLTYLIYATMTLFVLIWNNWAIPKTGLNSKLTFKKGKLSIRGIKGAGFLSLASLNLGISTAPFWTFSRTFIELAGVYSDWQLSLFWIVIGLFGVLGGFSGSLIEKWGLPAAYKLGSLLLASASIILAFTPSYWLFPYVAAGVFGSFYIFLTGALLVWGIRVFITNASLGISIPFLLLAVGQAIGSLLSGWFVGIWGYATTFIIFGLLGILATFIGPSKRKRE